VNLVLGREYWSALQHTTYFKLYGETPELIFVALREAMEDGDEEEEEDCEVPWKPGDQLVLPYLDLEHTVKRGFVLIEDSSGLIAQRLDEEARWDAERPWLHQYATALRLYPDDVELRARAMINLPDGRILDPDGPLGCMPMGEGCWMFVGFLPIDNDEVDYQDLDETERRELFRRTEGLT